MPERDEERRTYPSVYKARIRQDGTHWIAEGDEPRYQLPSASKAEHWAAALNLAYQNGLSAGRASAERVENLADRSRIP